MARVAIGVIFPHVMLFYFLCYPRCNGVKLTNRPVSVAEDSRVTPGPPKSNRITEAVFITAIGSSFYANTDDSGKIHSPLLIASCTT
ncbi:hypothetical protein D3C77_554740 [compost metagenome]